MTTTSTIWSPKNQASDSLEVYLLGLVDYESTLFLQERLVYEISGREDKQGGLLICEHPPMVTIGRDGSREHLLAEQREYTSRLMDIRWSNRGGGCLVHAPGQLAIYPIVPLDRLEIGLSEYRRRLEQAVIKMCEERHIPAERLEREAGVRCRTGLVASLGIAVKSWVAYHGLFVNVSPQMDLLRMVESNSQDEPVSSLARQSVRPVSMHSVRESMIYHLADQLGYEKYHIYTGHPLLRRTKRKIHAYA